MKPSALVLVHSYHHNCTEKVAVAIAGELGAEVKRATEVAACDVGVYDLVGFGAGIDSGHHYAPLLELARALPAARGQKAFLFSTSGVYTAAKMAKDHRALRDILQAKGYEIIGEFGCLGFNTNSFLIAFGGINKGKPDAGDLQNARAFAAALKQRTEQAAC